MKKQTILIISGPTASGKTELAINCAKEFNGEIISCDSMQIYKYLDIGTAKASQEEQEQVKHHLINVINPNEEYSVQQYVTRAKDCINDIVKRGKLPIIIGGTGLYIKSLIYPYSFCEAPKSQQIRDYYNEILNKNGKEYLFELLTQKDFEASKKIHINDTKRVIRALEICDITKGKKSDLNKESEDVKSEFNSIFIVLNPDRQTLYNKINRRVDIMFESGLLEEFNTTRNLFKLTEDSQSMQAIGYKELFQINEEKLNIQEVKELIKQHTRNYAKRQVTFMKSFKNAKWFTGENKNEILDYIQIELKGKK